MVEIPNISYITQEKLKLRNERRWLGGNWKKVARFAIMIMFIHRVMIFVLSSQGISHVWGTYHYM